MQSCSWSRWLWIGLLLLSISSVASAGMLDANALALGKPYTLDPKPNYQHCTDTGDNTQLTDGRYTKGHFWTQKTTVGWSSSRLVRITIDLGQVQPISGAAFSTAAGTADVTWPTAITILVSDDGRSYYHAGELISLSARNGVPPQSGYAVYRYYTDKLACRGRFVSFVVATGGTYIFTDEVELFRGNAALLQKPREGPALFDQDDLVRYCQVKPTFDQRLRTDIQAIQETAKNAELSAVVRRKITAELTSLEKERVAAPVQITSAFKAILPFNALHARIFQEQARLWRGLGVPQLSVWQNALWDLLDVHQTPPRQAKPVVDVTMMQGEFRAGAFNISNAGEKEASLQLQIHDLPGGINPRWVTMHEVLWTDTARGIPVAAALPEASRAGDAYRITVPSGMTRQVWFTFASSGVPTGSYDGKIVITGGNKANEVPLHLRISPMRFPEYPSLHVGGWDYTNTAAAFDVTPRNRIALIAYLQKHFVDSPWATSVVMPLGEYADDGKMNTAPDTTEFDKWVTDWPKARQYCIALGFDKKTDFKGTDRHTPLFYTKVSNWLRFWANHAQQLGIKPEQICLLFDDEPSTPEEDDILLSWGRAVRAAATGIKMWEDTCHGDPTQANQDMMAACHVLCPNRPTFFTAPPSFRNYYLWRREEGSELAFYSCSGPARLLDPYAYYRIQAWQCLQYGMTSSYFWAFCDSGGGSSWNEYAAKGINYCPFFLDAASVTSGKQMEAIREGTEDYEYFVILLRYIANAQKTGKDSAVIARAQQIMREGIVTVCNAPGLTDYKWWQQKDRTLADKVRLQILNAIEELAADKANITSPAPSPQPPRQ
jgi:hypothetical protein